MTISIDGVLNGELWSLDMGLLKAANGSALPWNDVEATPYGSNYDPVMALAQNHIHFINVPNTQAGQVDIFVIHFSFFQPTPQTYPSNGQTVLPAQHGKTSSFFQLQGVQQEFAYIPDDGSATYVVNVESNTTQVLAGPSSKDPNAFYFAGVTSLVQVDSTGAVSFLAYNQNDTAGNAAAKWANVQSIRSVAPPSSGTSSSSGGNSSSASPSGSKSASGSTASQSAGSSSGSSSNTSGAMSRGTVSTLVAGAMTLVLATFAF
jgi:hypothetical protein